MEEFKHLKNPYAEISKLIPHLSAKQICHQWNNELDPSLNHDPLTEDERKVIDEWVDANREADGTISWKFCQRDMKMRFNKYHSTNKIKNAWNSKHNRQKPYQKNVVRKQKRHESSEVANLPHQFLVNDVSHRFSVNEDVRPFAHSLLNGISNIGITPLPTIIEPNFFQPHAPQLLPNSSEFGICNYNYNNNSNLPIMEPKFQPCFPTIVLRPVF
ncbi:hypothetical protein RclHR1_05300008 [Rhizophagus clarus]|uniref:HTH myb-type domain-containing protein n=1 Tax=Rhizophagus clarus TaxID=94130 RepID=A0A2Z6SEI5_9GLOM|nr:hypothetical protein RclHR1_05300008 [Rhizophagus clarus]